MNTLILYGSKHGCTETCAQMLADRLSGEVDRINVNQKTDVDLSKYDTVVVGSPVYVGQILKEVRAFTDTYLNELKEKRLGLFICGMQEEHTLREELETDYPEELREAALVRACFGGEYHFDTMNLVEKMIIRKVAKVKTDVSEIREETISAFAHTMNDSREVIEQN